jgi:hypothetical protein
MEECSSQPWREATTTTIIIVIVIVIEKILSSSMLLRQHHHHRPAWGSFGLRGKVLAAAAAA